MMHSTERNSEFGSDILNCDGAPKTPTVGVSETIPAFSKTRVYIILPWKQNLNQAKFIIYPS